MCVYIYTYTYTNIQTNRLSSGKGVERAAVAREEQPHIHPRVRVTGKMNPSTTAHVPYDTFFRRLMRVCVCVCVCVCVEYWKQALLSLKRGV